MSFDDMREKENIEIENIFKYIIQKKDAKRWVINFLLI